jgi:replicative DNA helicase
LDLGVFPNISDTLSPRPEIAARNVVNAEHHAAAIADLRRRRTLAGIGVKLARSALTDFTASLEAQIVGALAELYAISHRSPSVYGFTAGEAARIAIEQIAAAYEKRSVSGLSERGAAITSIKPSA